MKLNTKTKHTLSTHEGAPAKHIDAMAALQRSVCSCLLWEREFYEDGQAIADRILELSKQVPLEDLGMLATKVRTEDKLRHVPLLLLAAMATHGHPCPEGHVRAAIRRTIQRADEMGEFLMIYAKVNGTTPDKLKPILTSQVKRGLADAFTKFDEYQLAKYNRKTEVTLKDIARIVDLKADTTEQIDLWTRLLNDELQVPDTWEVALLRGEDKGAAFTRLLNDQKLGYMALLKNLRNMVQAGVDDALIRTSILEQRGADRVLPFRFVAAARAVPQLEPELDKALIAGLEQLIPLTGTTVILVDVSGSMESRLSAKSDLTRMDAAATLASIIPGHRRVFSFSQELVEVPPRLGMAGVDAIKQSQGHGGTYLGGALRQINDHVRHDRLIVITDEQSHDSVPDPKALLAYLINPASAENGVGYGRKRRQKWELRGLPDSVELEQATVPSGWIHIDGFSENVLRFISKLERGF